jgi:deoxyguanosine kinase
MIARGLLRFAAGQYTRAAVTFRHIALEGPTGVGTSTLAERLATRLDATLVLEELENPFLSDFYAERPGSALQAQLFFLLSRHRQQLALRQSDLFAQLTISDYMFDKDRIYAFLNLDDNELFIYQRLYDLLSRDIVPPDLVIYLQAPTDVLIERLRGRVDEGDGEPPLPAPAYLQELNEAYHHFFFHYTATPLLVVETSHLLPEPTDAAMDDLLHQIDTMASGTRYYVPRAR